MIAFPVMLLRLVLATVLGGVIGLEREFHEQRAGMRTNALVSLGSALFTLLSAYGFLDLTTLSHVSVDPTRIASYIVAGIGFLGAGTIVVRQANTRGLTTAAAVWTVAAIGMTCGVGLYWVAVAVTALTLVVLRALRLLENRLLPVQSQAIFKVSLEPAAGLGTLVQQLYALCSNQGLIIEQVQAHPDHDAQLMTITCHHVQAAPAFQVLEEMRLLPGVQEARLDVFHLEHSERVPPPAKTS